MELVLKYLKNNLNLIANNEFTKLYKESEAFVEASEITDVLLQSGINPLPHMKHIPKDYAATLKNLTTINIPKNIEKIGTSAFWGCENLETVYIAEGLTQIGESAFSECHNLKHIDLPESLDNIYADAFGDSGLKSIVIPSMLTRIPMMCFQDCEYLETVTLGANTIEVASRAFDGCSSLTKVDLQNVEVIRSNAFSSCPKLLEIELPDTIRNIDPKAFDDQVVRLVCSKDSYGHKFAIKNHIRFRFK